MSMQLHSFFRSGTSQRLRIALNLKGLSYEYIAGTCARTRTKAKPSRRSTRKAWCPPWWRATWY